MRKFFRNIFSSRNRRQEARAAEQQAVMDEERIELKITENKEKNKR
jgi:hypothetical protein